MTDRLDAVLADILDRQLPDTIALMRLLMEAKDEPEAREVLIRRSAAGHRHAAQRDRIFGLWQAHPQAWTVVRATIDGIAHDRRDTTPDGTLRYWAGAFDALAEASPEASVALYSLGDPHLLAEATGEVAALLDDWRLLGTDRDLLDLGCGIGRFLVALAPKVRSMLGLDISGRMVAEARRRCASLPNVRVEQSEGRGLAALGTGSVDLVLAVDTFPYLVQAGGDLPCVYVGDIARILRPAGSALILNWSYRGSPDADRADIRRLAEASSLDVVEDGVAKLSTWDGLAFLLQKRDIA